MSLQNLHKNRKVADRLSRAIRAGQVSHAYLIEGDADSGKMEFAKEFIKALLCEEAPGDGCGSCVDCRKVDHDMHEDVIFAEGIGKTGSVLDEEIEEVQRHLMSKPNGKRNIAVIPAADTMTLKAQNRFLKTLEEPAPGTVIILLTDKRERLIPTIRSRCVSFLLDNSEYDPEQESARQAEKICTMILEGRPFYEVSALMNEYAKDREKALLLLDGTERFLGRILTDESRLREYKKEKIYDAVEAVEEARRTIQRGVYHSYALGRLILQMG